MCKPSLISLCFLLRSPWLFKSTKSSFFVIKGTIKEEKTYVAVYEAPYKLCDSCKYSINQEPVRLTVVVVDGGGTDGGGGGGGGGDSAANGGIANGHGGGWRRRRR